MERQNSDLIEFQHAEHALTEMSMTYSFKCKLNAILQQISLLNIIGAISSLISLVDVNCDKLVPRNEFEKNQQQYSVIS